MSDTTVQAPVRSLATTTPPVTPNTVLARATPTGNLAIALSPDGVAAESIRSVRAHLIAQHLRDGRRSLAVCAPAQGAGCSFVAANLAAAIAQTGMKVLLIDANFRDPSVGSYFRTERPSAGLYECLADPSLPIGSVVNEDPIPNLSVIFAGQPGPEPQEMLGGGVFKLFMEQCMRDYDLTIADTPPGNRFADARRVASVMRYAMIVTRRNHTYLRDVKTMVAELTADRARVIGTYLNDY